MNPYSPSRLRTWLAGLGVAIVLQGAVAAAVILSIDDEYDVGRYRNALIADVASEGDLQWSPVDVPASFRLETQTPPEDLQTVAAAAVRDAGTESEFAQALHLARHLSSGPGIGGGIQSNTVDAYRTIVEEGRGYCADYTQVLMGLSHAAGITAREWGMSFRRYSGDGHAFTEVYDSGMAKWVFLDSFYSFYVTDPDSGSPLSVREFRDRLMSGQSAEGLRLVEIVPERFGFKSATAAFEYYARGFEQLFLMGGNNVFSVDAHPITGSLGTLSRALEQGAAIVLGIQPRAKLMVTPQNEHAVRDLMHLKWLLYGALIISLVSGLLALYFAVRLLVSIRRSA